MTSASNQEIKCRRCQVSTESDMANGPPYHIRCPKCKIEVTLREDQSVGLRYSPRLLLNEFAQFLQSDKLASGEQLEAFGNLVSPPVDPLLGVEGLANGT